MYVFFQAEDGIRDIGVTGVQTCALPILAHGNLALVYFFSGKAREAAREARQATQLNAQSVAARDRKSAVKGRSVDLGGRRIIKNKCTSRITSGPSIKRSSIVRVVMLTLS